jgi:DNA helicase-2/ATP-dependent DNA helicase PcrA
LLVTFTNNAAREMLERIDNRDVLACTFHSLCYRLLREFLPYDRRPFTILDEDDMTKMLSSIITDMGYSIAAKLVVDHIGLMRSKGTPPPNLCSPDDIMGMIYSEYEMLRCRHNMFDFGALQVDALEFVPLVVSRWKYILIDEYQDTDPVQWELTKILERGAESVTVVCDDQQSIYGWRGADISNVLKFPEIFNADVINLRKNFRSTPEIVDVVNRVVMSAKEKLGEKDLVSVRESGSRPRILTYRDDRAEARGIVDMIVNRGSPNDHLILYRANWLSRLIEEELIRVRIPYRVVDGVGFYRRREIKDIIAYIRLIYNPLDEVAARRVINTPPRGIGKVTVENAIQMYGSLCEAIVRSNNEKISTFRGIIEWIRNESATPADMIQNIIKMTKYEAYIGEEDRIDNVKSLISGAIAFGGVLDDYMMVVTLLSDDNVQSADKCVKMMTIHAAKGTEAKYVYVIGLEDDILPHSFSSNVEEERRLFYVAVSRAKDDLVMTNAMGRWRFTKFVSGRSSRFLDEVKRNKL